MEKNKFLSNSIRVKFIEPKKENIYNIKDLQKIQKKLKKKTIKKFIKTSSIYIIMLLLIMLELLLSDIFEKFEKDYLLKLFQIKNKISFTLIYSLINLIRNYNITKFVTLLVGFSFLYKNKLKACFYISLIFLIKIICSFCQIIFQQKRPYWNLDNNLVNSNLCMRTYSLPDDLIYDICLCLYFIFIYYKKDLNKKQRIFFYLFFGFWNFFISFFLWIDGQIYLFQIIVSYCLILTIWTILKNYKKTLENILEGSTINKNRSRKPRFYFLLFLISLAITNYTLNLIIEEKLSFENIKNYKKCQQNNNKVIPNEDPFSLIGKIPSVKNSHSIYSFIGFFLSILLIFNSIKDNNYWFKQPRTILFLQYSLFFFFNIFFIGIIRIVYLNELFLEKNSVDTYCINNFLWFLFHFFVYGGTHYFSYLFFKKYFIRKDKDELIVKSN